MPGIRLENVSRTFGNFVAVDGIDLSVNEGEFVTLLGPSGCGKTTTLRMIAGLEKNTGGRISIGDKVVSDAEAGLFVAAERRNLGMVFQSYAIWPHMRVFDNIAYPLKIRRTANDELQRRVGDVLRLIEMEAFASRPAPALSGGQQQRVAIARALVIEPNVLLLDEPLSNLDAKLRVQMGDEFRALQRRLGITTIYVTHDQEEAIAMSDRIAVMHAGNVLQFAKPDVVYERPDNIGVARFFGSPNLLPATVVAGSGPDADGRFNVSVEGEGWRGHARSAAAMPAGMKTTVMLRPEGLQLRPAGSSDSEVWFTGTVTDVVYRGSRSSITVRTPAQELRIDAASWGRVEIGESVEICVRGELAWAIPLAGT